MEEEEINLWGDEDDGSEWGEDHDWDEEDPEYDDRDVIDKAKDWSEDISTMLGGVVDVVTVMMANKDEVTMTELPDNPDVRLLGVQFHQEDSNPESSAIPLYTISKGWMPGDRTPVAYAIRPTSETIQKGKLKIWACFENSHGKGKLKVRTRIQDFDWLDVLNGKITQQGKVGRGSLGNAKETMVFFNDSKQSVFRGKHTYVPFTLEDPLYPELGIGIFEFNWVWEYITPDREASKKAKKTVWKDDWRTVRTMDSNMPVEITSRLEMSKHRLYTTLDLPSPPWSTHRVPDLSKGLPISLPLWTHGLDLACKWARGAKDRNQVAQLITDAIYNCGYIIYHPEPHYSSLHERDQNFGGVDLDERDDAHIAYFRFDKVLERLSGGHGLGPKMNCMDLALTVATLANMLGCKMRVGKLQNLPDIDATDEDHYTDNRFEINPIKPIGFDSHLDVVPGVNDGEKAYFAYHTIAWMAEHEEFPTREDFLNPRTTVYDASLEFYYAPNDNYCSGAGHALGNADMMGTYIHELAAATPEGLPRCNPQPITVLDIQITD